jgi:hypothetical protein
MGQCWLTCCPRCGPYFSTHNVPFQQLAPQASRHVDHLPPHHTQPSLQLACCLFLQPSGLAHVAHCLHHPWEPGYTFCASAPASCSAAGRSAPSKLTSYMPHDMSSHSAIVAVLPPCLGMQPATTLNGACGAFCCCWHQEDRPLECGARRASSGEWRARMCRAGGGAEGAACTLAGHSRLS